MNTPRMLDFPVGMAWGLAWFTLGLVAAMVLGLLVLRWWRWRREPRLAAFEAYWHQCCWPASQASRLCSPCRFCVRTNAGPF